MIWLVVRTGLIHVRFSKTVKQSMHQQSDENDSMTDDTMTDVYK